MGLKIDLTCLRNSPQDRSETNLNIAHKFLKFAQNKPSKFASKIPQTCGRTALILTKIFVVSDLLVHLRSPCSHQISLIPCLRSPQIFVASNLLVYLRSHLRFLLPQISLFTSNLLDSLPQISLDIRCLKSPCLPHKSLKFIIQMSS